MGVKRCLAYHPRGVCRMVDWEIWLSAIHWALFICSLFYSLQSLGEGVCSATSVQINKTPQTQKQMAVNLKLLTFKNDLSPAVLTLSLFFTGSIGYCLNLMFISKKEIRCRVKLISYIFMVSPTSVENSKASFAIARFGFGRCKASFLTLWAETLHTCPKLSLASLDGMTTSLHNKTITSFH